ncbi:unnamed protein product [Orchesella dallaii]|uniref:Uncharacterized protein n=1 Tax=Orchesella dallaii TaxID=48710 RepID=A0ABP1S1X5_9HEXA
MELNTTGKDLYRQARRLSLALRSRSPSPAATNDRGRSNTTRKTSNSSTTPEEKKPKAEPEKPTSSSKKVTLMRQVTLVDLPQKLAEVMNNPSETVNIVKVKAPSQPNISVTDPSGKKMMTEDIIMIVPGTPSNSQSTEDLDAITSANENGDGENGEQDRESFLINVKMKKSQGNNGTNGKPKGLRTAISGIAVGISRLPKNQALRKKLKENKIAVVTADVLTDMGCVAFADKQKQVLSQACSIL